MCSFYFILVVSHVGDAMRHVLGFIFKFPNKTCRRYSRNIPEFRILSPAPILWLTHTACSTYPLSYSPSSPNFSLFSLQEFLTCNKEGGLVINTSTSTSHHRAVQESRREYVEALAKKEEETKRVEMLKEGGEVGFGSDRFWWDRSIEGMGLEELEQYVASMEELKKNVGIRVDELEKASNSPSRFLDLDSGVHAIENLSTN